jgi:hypothetical protein
MKPDEEGSSCAASNYQDYYDDRSGGALQHIAPSWRSDSMPNKLSGE